MRQALDHLVRVMREAEAGNLDRYALVGVSAARGILEHQRWLAEREDRDLMAQLRELLGGSDEAVRAFLLEKLDEVNERLAAKGLPPIPPLLPERRIAQ